MNISDNELREKLLAEITRKGTLSTRDLIRFGNTWASDSKIRDTLFGLKEENMIHSYRLTNNQTAEVLYSLVDKPEMKTENPDVNKTLKHEFEIILRKQKRRREFACRILQNAEATIKHLEGMIK